MFSNHLSKSCFPKSEEMYFPSNWSDNSVYDSLNNRGAYSPPNYSHHQSPRKDNYSQMKIGPTKPQIQCNSPLYEECTCSMCLSYKSYYSTIPVSCREPACPCYMKSYSTSPPQNYQYFSAAAGLSPQFSYQRATESLTSLDEQQFEPMNCSNSFLTGADYMREVNSSKNNSYNIHIDTEVVMPTTGSPKRPITSQIHQSPSFSSSSSAPQSHSQSSPDGIQFLKSIDPIECNALHRQDATNKPPYSYITLIVSAMRSKSSRKITLNEIYAWIMSNFAYYRRNVRRWQNSIRHALSFNDCFIKVPRPSGEAGKGNYWTVHPNAIDMFENGSTMRRNRKFIDSSKDGVANKRRRTSSCKSPKTLLQQLSTNSPLSSEMTPEKPPPPPPPQPSSKEECCDSGSLMHQSYVSPDNSYLLSNSSDYAFPGSTMNFDRSTTMRSSEQQQVQGNTGGFAPPSLSLSGQNDYLSPYRVWSDSQSRFPISGDVC